LQPAATSETTPAARKRARTFKWRSDIPNSQGSCGSKLNQI
jgi:hypothetical protein